jgi:hypothetical protein
MSYRDMKSRIDRLSLSLAPACVATTHEGATLWAGRLCGWPANVPSRLDCLPATRLGAEKEKEGGGQVG